MARQKLINIPILQGYEIDWIKVKETSNSITTTTVITGVANHGVLYRNRLAIANAFAGNAELSEFGNISAHDIEYGGGEFDVITITTIRLQKILINGYYSEFSMNQNAQNFPVERKSTKTGTSDEIYKTWWNHNVISTNANETINEADWKAMTTVKRPSGYTVNPPTAYWAKTNQALKAGETVILAADKPGIQSFNFPVEEVKEKVYATDQATMNSLMTAIGKLKVPVDSAGFLYDEVRDLAENWLVTSGNYVKRYGWYEGERRYLYAKGGHDTDLYPEAPTT